MFEAPKRLLKARRAAHHDKREHSGRPASRTADMSDIEQLQHLIRDFAHLRNWQRFHTPKNLAMAVAGEAGELVAEMQWLTPDDSLDLVNEGGPRRAVAEEIADVAIYLLRLADVLRLDLAAEVRSKMEANEVRFPPP